MQQIDFCQSNLERQGNAHAIEVSVLLGIQTNQMPRIFYR